MFDISIEQKVLMEALESLESTVGKNATGLGDNCLAMYSDGSGATIEMYTTNTLEFTKLNATLSGGGTDHGMAPYVDFKRFKSIIASIPESEVVSIKENINDLLINFALKKTPIKLVGCTNGMLPLPSNQFSQAANVTIPKGIVTLAINAASNIVTDSQSTPMFNCMRIFTTGVNVEFTAIDITDKRTFYMNGLANNNNSQEEIFLEISKFKKALKLFHDFNELEVYMDNSMIRIDGTDVVPYPKTGMVTDVSYYARRVGGVFPKGIKAAFNPPPTEYAEVNIKDLEETFARVKAIEDQTSGGQIGFKIKEDTCSINLNSSYGNVEDEITLENTVSQSFSTVFKYNHLSDIMKVIGEDVMEIGVLPAHPTNYVIKSKGGKVDMSFTVSGMVGKNGQSSKPNKTTSAKP